MKSRPAICGDRVRHVENLVPDQWYWFSVPSVTHRDFGMAARFKEICISEPERHLCLLVIDRYGCEQRLEVTKLGGVWKLPQPDGHEVL